LRINSKYFIFISIALLLIQCKPSSQTTTEYNLIPIDSNVIELAHIKTFIQPYKDSLDKEMNEVLVISSEEFPKEKGKAQTKLGNLVADLSLEIAQKMYSDNIDFCLLNFGGLRTSLPKGEITRGKIFELMPFENELVVVTISRDSISNLIKYIKDVGGQPISGDFKLKFGKSIMTGDQITKADSIWYKTVSNKLKDDKFAILTSDYLANGGDNMKFFLNPIKTEKVGIKLRDAIIQYCIEQNKQGNQIESKINDRIIFEK
jgi:2',3'-cyclic-nucleotide 2'-phosphodiesterase (5'-nucleotidase family)